jgi:uncharacterized protein YecT (DUF1311 family)
MKSNIALLGVWAVLLISACARDPAVAPEIPSSAQHTDAAPEETPAADVPATPCEDATDQLSMTECWSQESRTAEEGVDAALKKLDELFAAKASSAARQHLQDDQRRWHEFVAGHCGLFGDLLEGGSAAPMAVAVCRWRLAQTRSQQLGLLIDELDR